MWDDGNVAIKRGQRLLADYAEREQRKDCEAGLTMGIMGVMGVMGERKKEKGKRKKEKEESREFKEFREFREISENHLDSLCSN